MGQDHLFLQVAYLMEPGRLLVEKGPQIMGLPVVIMDLLAIMDLPVITDLPAVMEDLPDITDLLVGLPDLADLVGLVDLGDLGDLVDLVVLVFRRVWKIFSRSWGIPSRRIRT